MSENHRKPRTAAALAEIRRVWVAGMSASDIAKAVNPDIVTPKKASINQYFTRWKEELKPCELPKPTPKIVLKPVVTIAEKPVEARRTYKKNGITLPKVFDDD